MAWIEALGGGGGGSSKSILYYFTDSAYFEGYIVRATGLLSRTVYEVELNAYGNGYVEVNGMEHYTIELITTDENDQEVVEYTTEVSANNGCFYYINLGFTTSTWKGIQNILDAHLETSLLDIGDELTTMIGGTQYTYQIGAIDLYESHEVIFVPKTCIGTRQHHTSDTNAGGWAQSDIRTYLNGTFKDGLEDDIRNNLKEIEFKSSAGGQSTSITTTTDKIWLPREYEIFGATTYAANTEAQYCRQYPIFATQNQRIRTNNGVASYWWEASAHVSNSTRFCLVYTDGSATGGIASYSFGLVPCFRFTAN